MVVGQKPRDLAVKPTAKNLFSAERKELLLAVLWLLAIVLVFLPDFSLTDASKNPFHGNHVSGDYLVFWFAGLEASLGRAVELYDPVKFTSNIIENFGAGFKIATWLYPPHILFLYAGLSKLSYGLGWLVYTLVSVGIYLFTVNRLFPGNPRMLLLSAIAPVTFVCIVQGQSGFLVSSLLLGAFFVLPKRPVLAGILIGLLTIKPQLGILIPFILIFERQFVTFAVAGVTAIAVMAASALWLGVEVWQQYITSMLAGSSAELLQFIASLKIGTMVTVYGFVSAIGASHSIALMAQGLTALLCLVAAFYVSRSHIDAMSKMATYVLLSYLVSPYIMSYDLQAPAVVAAMVLSRVNGQSYSLTERTLAGAVLMLSFIQLASERLFIPVAVLFLLGFAVAMVMRCLRYQGERVAHHRPKAATA